MKEFLFVANEGFYLHTFTIKTSDLHHNYRLSASNDLLFLFIYLNALSRAGARHRRRMKPNNYSGNYKHERLARASICTNITVA